MAVLLTLLIPPASAQEIDSAMVASDTTVLPMATGYDWITYRGSWM